MGSINIKAFIVLFLGLGFALYLGLATATAQFEAISWVAGGLLLAVCLLLGKNVWILIPATLSMRGGLNFLPGSPAPWHAMTALAAAFFLLNVALRRQSLKLHWGWMETILLLVGLTIAQAFVRAPVGFYALGGDVAGGKPYFFFAVAFVAYLVIALSEPDLRAFRSAVILYIVFGVADGLIGAASQAWPDFARFMLPVYSNVSYSQAIGLEGGLNLAEGRFSYVGQLGSLLGLVACTFWRPLAALDLTKPWRGLVAGFACVLVPLSGFRSLSGLLFTQFLVGSAIRRKWLDIVFITVAGLALVFVLAIGGFVRSLPFGAQRVLSILPVEVDSRARLQAEGSSEDRFEMWRLAMGSDRFIENKALGDGFSLKAREVKAMSDSLVGVGRISFVEHSMSMGSYHGFHVETIRYTGLAGLLAATLALVVFAVRAWRNIQAFRDHPYWTYVLFVSMPFLIHPLWYWLVFGSYKANLPQVIAMAGMIKLLDCIRLAEQPAAVVPKDAADADMVLARPQGA